MTEPGATKPLVALCRHCGAQVPVVLAGPPPRCDHCHSDEPFDPTTRLQVESLRTKLAQRATRLRQLSGRQIERIQGLGGWFVMIMATCWLLFGTVGFIFSLSHDRPLVAFVLETYRATEAIDELVAKWWMLLALVTSLTATLALMGLASLRLKTLALGSLPLPPASPGGEARCRCCAAELEPGGAVRRCIFCGADNLVLGQRYRTTEHQLDRALDHLGRGFGRALGSRVDLASRVATAGAAAPALLPIVVLPAGLLIGVTAPTLWILPALFTLVAAVVWPLTLRIKLPRIYALENLLPDDQVNFDGQPHWVRGFLHLHGEDGPPERWALLAQQRFRSDPSRLLQVHVEGDRLKTTLLTLTSGGAPLGPEHDPAGLPRAELRWPGETTTGPIRLEEGRALRTTEPGVGRTLRVWIGQPAAGDPPAWTAGAAVKHLMVDLAERT